MGVSPCIITDILDLGLHILRFEKDGYSTEKEEIEITEDLNKMIRVNLKALTGQVVIIIKGTWANVEIDGRKYGTTPLSDPISLKAGMHEVRLINPLLEPFVQKFSIQAGETHELSFDRADFTTK